MAHDSKAYEIFPYYFLPYLHIKKHEKTKSCHHTRPAVLFMPSIMNFFQGTRGSASDWPLIGPFSQFFQVCGHLVQPLSFQRGTCSGVSTSNDPTVLRVMIKIQQSPSKMELYGRMPLRETVLNKLIQVWVLHL